MIRIRRSEERGHAEHGWLDTYHTFSFADYYDSDHVQFGPLRVLNQDRVAPGAGFPTHSHRDMEILTYPLAGMLEHKDSAGHASFLVPGDVQVMSAGRGISHSEWNGTHDQTLELLQIWLVPRTRGREPGYSEAHFPLEDRRGRLRLIASPDGADGSLAFDVDARVYASLLAPGEALRHAFAPGRAGWIHVARGRLRLAEHELAGGDGVALSAEPAVALSAVEDSELLLFDLPYGD